MNPAPTHPVPVWPADPATIDRAAEALREGGLVGMPTETVYGLAGDARSPQSLARIFAVKRRPTFDPLILHVTGLDDLTKWTTQLPRQALKLAEAFWPGPLTLVLPKRAAVPDLATSGLPDVAIRCPNHPVALALLQACGFPLAAPSANPFGGLSPTRPEHVSEAFAAEEVCGVLDGGPCGVGVESTIVAFPAGDAGNPVCLRPGGLALEMLEAVLNRPIDTTGHLQPASDRPLAPGALPWHYAPRTPLRLASAENPRETQAPDTKHCGYLAFSSPPAGEWGAMEVLSSIGDLEEAATRLFAALHTLDRGDWKRIVAETVPESGLGLAINDRLRKAAAAPTGRF